MKYPGVTGLLVVVVVVALALSLSCGSNKSNPTQPDDTGKMTFLWLSTQGNKIIDEENAVRVLRGVNRSGLEYDKSGAGVSEEEIMFICSQWKAQIIRLPFNQDWILRDPAYLAFFEKVIGWINQNGAYALLDLQWRNTTDKIPPIPDEEAVTMWRMLAEKYKNNPGILYDIHNEAHDTSWQLWRARASQIIEAIQAVHPRALIFVSGLDWAYDLRGWGDNPLPYNNIVYSSHPYPFKGEPWAWDKYFGGVAAQYPVFIGEFGGGSADLSWGASLLSYMDGKNLGWTAWSWSNEPYLTQGDRRTATEFGQLVHNALLRHAGQQPAGTLTVTQIKVNYIDRDRATITWNSNNESDSKVRYGVTAAYTDSLHASALLKSHTIKLAELAPGTLYHFQVLSVDKYGAQAVSADSTFATLP